jgi:hypothetical protein
MGRFISYWIFPVLSGVIWLATLLGLLLYWIVSTDMRFYDSMEPGARVAFISDIGASDLKPLFIAGSVLTTVFLDIGFALDRWLRHRGRLVPNGTIKEKVFSALGIVFALLGTAGLILLSIFDTVRHPKLHRVFLLLFVLGYLLSAVFLCCEFWVLGKKNRDHRVLRTSFWLKLVFIIVEFTLAVVFAVMLFRHNNDVAGVLEWIIALIFTLYVVSFALDLWPATRTRGPGKRFATRNGSGATGEEKLEDGLAVGGGRGGDGGLAPAAAAHTAERWQRRAPHQNF